MQQLLDEYADNPEAQDVIRIIHESNDSVFLTGKAGTGKSYLLRKIIEHCPKKHIVLAPTGIAAIHVEGQTIHSFFLIEPRPYLPEDPGIDVIKSKVELLRKTELIIIDEISMVRADLMNAIDVSLRRHLNSHKPFAGKQLLLIGDLYQLPPVLDKRRTDEVHILNSFYKTPYFFSCPAMESGFSYHLVELTKVYRQKDSRFIGLLNSVRDNNIKPDQLNLLNSRYVADYSPLTGSHEIVLATTNEIVKRINTDKLNQLPGKSVEFKAESTGNFKGETNDNRLPADKVLQLKPGSRVMFIKNDLEKRWVNGSLGTILIIEKDSVTVEMDSGSTHVVRSAKWESHEYEWNQGEGRIDKKVAGTFTQIPLKLAWAVTIHKSQGQTFNEVVVNLGNGAFATGQTYVALSRCTSFDGIKLQTRISPRDIQVDTRISRYFIQKAKGYFELE